MNAGGSVRRLRRHINRWRELARRHNEFRGMVVVRPFGPLTPDEEIRYVDGNPILYNHNDHTGLERPIQLNGEDMNEGAVELVERAICAYRDCESLARETEPLLASIGIHLSKPESSTPGGRLLVWQRDETTSTRSYSSGNAFDDVANWIEDAVDDYEQLLDSSGLPTDSFPVESIRRTLANAIEFQKSYLGVLAGNGASKRAAITKNRLSLEQSWRALLAARKQGLLDGLANLAEYWTQYDELHLESVYRWGYYAWPEVAVRLGILVVRESDYPSPPLSDRDKQTVSEHKQDTVQAIIAAMEASLAEVDSARSS